MSANVICSHQIRRIGLWIVFSTSLMLGGHDAFGQCQSATLTSENLEVDDAFGFDLALNGDVALVGAKGDAFLGENSGAAYVFRRNGSGWIEEQKLVASDGEIGDVFGGGLDINGNTLFIGAMHDTHLGVRSGSVYIFQHNGSAWVETGKVFPPDGELFDRFGSSLASNTNLLVVGSPNHDQLGSSAGAAYVYRRVAKTWIFETKLTASDGVSGDTFGNSVAIDNDVIVVGADDTISTGNGAAYVYRFNGSAWIEEAKLMPSDGGVFELFGSSLAIAGNNILIGSWGDIAAGFLAGAVYAYQFDGSVWGGEQKIIAPDAQSGDHFGFSIDLEGTMAIATASREHSNGLILVYQLIQGVWVYQSTLEPLIPPSSSPGGFRKIALSSPEILKSGNNEVFLFSLDISANDCNANNMLDNCDIATGFSIDCNNNGIPDECDLDCNGNGVPNDCELAESFLTQSPSLSPVQFGTPLEFVIPNATPAAGNSVNITITVTADLDNVSEYINVQINGLQMATLFANDGLPCTEQTATISYPVSAFNQILAATGPDLTVKLIPSLTVTTDECSSPSATIRIEYQTQTDSNANLIPDACESAGDVNGDAVVDTDDLLLLLGEWGDCPAAPDACMGDTNFDNAVDVLDLLAVLGNWS